MSAITRHARQSAFDHRDRLGKGRAGRVTHGRARAVPYTGMRLAHPSKLLIFVYKSELCLDCVSAKAIPTQCLSCEHWHRANIPWPCRK